MRQTPALLCLACLFSPPALANDSIAELGTGGLVLSRSDVIAMEREDLFISTDRVEVDYVFRNGSDEDVHAVVAFPMPDIEGNPWTMPAIPLDTQDNFLGFEVRVDGKPVTPQLQHRAFAADIDVTEELEAAGVPLLPFGDDVAAALADIDPDTVRDWVDRGIVVIDEFDAGAGWERIVTPFWKLRSAYWWRTVFPAGEPVSVWHRYQPSVGATVGLTFFHDGRFHGDEYAAYKARYCMDESFERAITRIARESGGDWPPLMENRISYVLTTGGNWAGGEIGRFTLTIDKGKPGNLVSFCGTGVKKIGPTTFEMTREAFRPERDLDILILERHDGAN